MRHNIPQFITARDVVWAQVLIAIALYCAGDVLIGGPLTELTLEYALIRPVEAQWGFHADSLGSEPGRLVVESVDENGAFERAGIKPGFAFYQRHCFAGFDLDTWWYEKLASTRQTEIAFVLPPQPTDPCPIQRIKVALPPQ